MAEELQGQKGQAKSRHPLEYVALTLLGLFCLAALAMTLISLGPDVETGQVSLLGIPLCGGPALGALGSMAMIWFRNRYKAASAWLAVGIIFWFIGVSALGFGGFTTFTPGESPFMTDLAISTAFCFLPGLLLTLGGVAAYVVDHRPARRTADRPVGLPSAAEVQGEWTEKLHQAAEYRHYITQLLKQQQTSHSYAEQLSSIPARLEAWETQLKRLVQRLNAFEHNPLIQRDIHQVAAAIARLQQELEQETRAQIRVEILETLDRQRKYQQQLDKLVDLMRRTELDIEETLAQIGSIYSQLQLLEAREIDSSRMARLSDDIEEEANRLNDLLQSMDEIYDRSNLAQAK